MKLHTRLALCTLTFAVVGSSGAGCQSEPDEDTADSEQELLLKASFFGKDQGMWPYHRIPRKKIERNHKGLSLTDTFVDHLRRSSLKIFHVNGWGSGSFISKNGLVLTNFHVARPYATRLVAEGFDPVTNGYFAAAPSADKTLPEPPSVRVVEDIQDVTAQIDVGLAGLSEADRSFQISTQTQPVVDQCMAGLDPEKAECEVIAHDGGATFTLYRYKVYKDVRLVGLPPESAANFATALGADPYAFPQWHADFAFFRVYENGVPLATDDYLTWNAAPLKESDTIVVSGFPSWTQRGWSLSNFYYSRDKRYGDFVSREQAIVAGLNAALTSATDPVDRAALETSIASWHNSLLGDEGALIAFSNPEVEQTKKNMEAFVELSIAMHPRKYAAYKGFFPQVAANAQNLTLEKLRRYRTLDPDMGWTVATGSGHGATFVKLAEQMKLPDAERIAGYHESEVDDWYKSFLTGPSDNLAVERALWGVWLDRIATDFANDASVQAILTAQPKEQRIASFLTSDMYDVAKRTALYDAIRSSGGTAIDGTTDSVLSFMKELQPALTAATAAFKAASFEPWSVGDKSARAHKAVFGDLWPSEAATDLRFSVGTVKRFNATGPARIATDFAGMFMRAAEHPGEAPYDLPQLWRDSQGAFSPSAQFVVAHTADTWSGNSGSPVVKANGEVVGVHYGLNDPDSDAQDYVHTTDKSGFRPRGMMLTTQAIEQVLLIHGASPLLSEARLGHR